VPARRSMSDRLLRHGCASHKDSGPDQSTAVRSAAKPSFPALARDADQRATRVVLAPDHRFPAANPCPSRGTWRNCRVTPPRCEATSDKLRNDNSRANARLWPYYPKYRIRTCSLTGSAHHASSGRYGFRSAGSQRYRSFPCHSRRSDIRRRQ